MSLRLVKAFGVVSQQGNPIGGRRRFGVPPGGVFDPESWILANTLAGCPSLDPAWELSMAQASFRAEQSGIVGVAGATAVIRHRAKELETGVAFSIQAGDQFVVEAPTRGARVYVSFGAAVRPAGWHQKVEKCPDSVGDRLRLRLLPGPQSDLFEPGELTGPFTVTSNISRVGLRLEPAISAHSVELPSEPQCVGTVQVANDGTLILLGPDGPTIGGYPKIAVVPTCDIARMGQLQPGDKLRFSPITIEEARVELDESLAALGRRLQMLRLASGF